MSAQTLSFSAAVPYGHLTRATRSIVAQVRLTADLIVEWDIDARVDSGSSFCVFGRQWADLLGLDWQRGDQIMISTAAGRFEARLHEVVIKLLEFEWTAWVAFAEWDTVPPSPARDVLGLNGFFDHFLVAIDDIRETIYLEPRF
ncbi:MAG TPA: hypothetical protein VN345_14480 [Blastocatellia bacterium]|jgi:hypothetical protein|nr:hypothetical protein [Blastocatellia bacterium]